jgi:peptide/nickel transport system ATP-binding protein
MILDKRETENLLEVRNLQKCYSTGTGLFTRNDRVVKAVDGVSFDVHRGEIFGLVGESGSGKTTTGRCILRLIEPDAGSILFDGNDLLALDSPKMRAMRKRIQMIFQDPFASLNPRMTVGRIVEEPLVIHHLGARKRRKERVAELLQMVGLDPGLMKRFPHEFSGGQRQRIGIARALALEPELIVADEPVSALDVSVQAQIINLLKELQEKLNLTVIFIAHDLSVVRHFSDRIGVMYLGKLVEVAKTDDLFAQPFHPYTRVLLDSIPIPDPEKRGQQEPPRGEIPSLSAPPSGCRFHPRCPIAISQCQVEEPPLRELSPGHWAACHLAGLS